MENPDGYDALWKLLNIKIKTLNYNVLCAKPTSVLVGV